MFYFEMYFKINIYVFLSTLLICHVKCRPWEIKVIDTPYTGTFVPIIRELDAWAASLLSDPQVSMVGAGAALAYLGYAGALLLAGEESKPAAAKARSLNDTSDLFGGVASGVVQEALLHSESAVAFRRAGARALQHGATVLRRSLNAFSRAVGTIFTALSTSQRALGPHCVSQKMCQIGQMTGMRWPVLGVLLRSLDSSELDEYAQALIDGTTIGDCTAIYPNCPD